MEKWKIIEGYEGLYEVSNLGNIMNLKKGKLLSNTRFNKDGYIHCALRKDGKSKEFMAHRLVASAFLDNVNNKDTVNHINGIKSDNRLENLEWHNRSEQMEHAYLLGLKKPMKGCKALNEEQIKEIKSNYKRNKRGFGSVALAEKYGVHSNTILRVVNGHYD